TFIGSTVASILLALILTVLPYLGLSNTDGVMIIGALVLLGVILFQVGDLKELVKRNYKRGRRLVVGSRPPKPVELPEFFPQGKPVEVAVVPSGRKLTRGGTVLSPDRTAGDLATGDGPIGGSTIGGAAP